MKKLNFPVIIEQDENSVYIVTCPLFKGCHSYGDTIEEAMLNIKEVIDICIEESEGSEHNKYIGVRQLEIVQDA